MRELWHYTCSHQADGIGEHGILQPRAQPLLGNARLIWLTDMDVPDRDGLGLTSHILKCDRTEIRYRTISNVGVEPWFTSRWRAEMDPVARDDFEFYGRPLRWFVSPLPQSVVRS